jgi:hypothetical protein
VFEEKGLLGLKDRGWEKVEESSRIKGGSTCVPVTILEIVLDTIDVETAEITQEQFDGIGADGLKEDDIDGFTFENETTISGSSFALLVNDEELEIASLKLGKLRDAEENRLNSIGTCEVRQTKKSYLRRENANRNERYRLIITEKFDIEKLGLTLANDRFARQKESSYLSFDFTHNGLPFEYVGGGECKYTELYLIDRNGNNIDFDLNEE